MTRRLLGYVVSLGGMWMRSGPGGSVAFSSRKEGRAIFQASQLAEALACADGLHAVPVFAVPRKPKPPTSLVRLREQAKGALDVAKALAALAPKPAPFMLEEFRDVPVRSRHVRLRHPAAGDVGRIVVFSQGDACVRVERLTKVNAHMCEFGSVSTDEGRGQEGFEVSRCYVIDEPEGAREAAIAAAREEGRREGIEDLRDRLARRAESVKLDGNAINAIAATVGKYDFKKWAADIREMAARATVPT